MIRLLYLELKKIFKSKAMIIGTAIIILISLNISINLIRGARILDREYNKVYEGIDAINKMNEISKDFEGELTKDKLVYANDVYVEISNQYNGIDNVPEDIYQEKIWPIRDLINMVGWISSDPASNITIPPEERKNEDIENFYDNRDVFIEKSLSSKQLKNNPVGLKKALEINSLIIEPFYYSSHFGWFNVLENITLLLFIITVTCIAILSPSFSSEYQTDSDSILRCTVNGRTKLALIKIFSGIIISSFLFLIGIAIVLLIFCSVFSIDGLSTSVQIILVSCIAPVTIGNSLFITIISGFISIICIVCFTLFVSSKCKNQMITFIISTIVVLLPTILDVFWKSNFSKLIQVCLPSGGVGIGTGMLFELIFLQNFPKLGSFAFWSPYLLVISAILQIPLFFILGIVSYNKHEIS